MSAGFWACVDDLPAVVADPGVDDASAGDESTFLEPASDGGNTMTCVSDPDFCTTRCGTVVDNCGVMQACSTDCGQNKACDGSTHQCACVPLPSFCGGRCGSSTDNCGATENCGGCDAGLNCSAGNACGCDPVPVATRTRQFQTLLLVRYEPDLPRRA